MSDATLRALTGMSITYSNTLRDDVIYIIGTRPQMLIGTRPWTSLEKDGERAVRIVRHGLASILAALGEDVGPAPDDPYPLRSGKAIIADAFPPASP